MLLVILLIVVVGPSYLSEDLCPPELVCITVLKCGHTGGAASEGLAYSWMPS